MGAASPPFGTRTRRVGAPSGAIAGLAGDCCHAALIAVLGDGHRQIVARDGYSRLTALSPYFARLWTVLGGGGVNAGAFPCSAGSSLV